MSPVAWQLDDLEGRIDKLRREYDLFFAGRRRGAPIVLRDEVERLILKLTRDPSSSTAVQFRLRSLAHRFRALDGQVRQRIEAGERRAARKASGGVNGSPEVSVLLDAAAVANPGAVLSHLLRIHRAVQAGAGDNAKELSLERLQERLLGEARKQLQQPGVKGVRFRVVQGEGGTRIRGEVLEGP
ncbi:MAG TPA: hypothetical protein VK997_07580 [Deferrisomatales bacterium]|nr:hypothetical protein [Deferrisomatales bacterium]